LAGLGWISAKWPGFRGGDIEGTAGGWRCFYPSPQYLENVIANCHKNEKERKRR